MQNALMTVGLLATATNAAQIAFISHGDGSTCTSLDTAAKARAAVGRVPEFTGFGGFTEDCFDLTNGVGKSTAECDAQKAKARVYAKLGTTSGLVTSLDLYSDAACATKMNVTASLTTANAVTNGYTQNVSLACGGTFTTPVAPQPFSLLQGGVAGVVLTTPRAVAVQTFYTTNTCATPLQATNFATGQYQAAPFGVGACHSYTFNPDGVTFRKITIGAGGMVQEKYSTNATASYKTGYLNNFRPLKLTAAQCGSVATGVVTPIAAAFDAASGECTCQADAATSTVADDEACAILGGACHVKATGAASTGTTAGICGVSISKVNTAGGSADGTGAGQCGNIANNRTATSTQGVAAIPTVAGTWSVDKCICTSHAQCAANKWCFTEYGQQGSPSAPGLCGTFDTAVTAGTDGACHPMFRLAADDAAIPLGVCQADTSIWTVSGANNVIAASGAAVALAMATLFA